MPHRLPAAADAGVYDDQVDRPRWKVSIGGLEEKRACADVLRRDMMCQVNDLRIRGARDLMTPFITPTKRPVCRSPSAG